MKAAFTIFEQKPNSVQLNVTGDLLMTSALEFQQSLIPILNAVEVTINLKQAKSIDASALQIIKAMANARESKGQELIVEWPEIKEVKELLINTNLLIII